MSRMTIKEVQDEIIRLKKEKDICILAHSYQAREIIEVADYTGDSYALSKIAAKAPNKTVIMCGVRFMAETCKILSPEKTVILSNPTAGCPMAEQMDREFILDLKKKHPGYTVVAYVNGVKYEEGSGQTKKMAEQVAAHKTIIKLNFDDSVRF